MSDESTAIVAEVKEEEVKYRVKLVSFPPYVVASERIHGADYMTPGARLRGAQSRFLRGLHRT